MRKFGSAAAVAAILSLATAPALAAPATSASSLSLSRAVTKSGHRSKLAGGEIVAIIAAVAIIGGGVALIASNEDETPDSP